MELWVRSQDKKRLLKIDDIGIVDYNGYYYVVGYKNGKEIKLGEYEFHTATRALEVLDEIQKIIGWIQNDMKDVTIGDYKRLIGSFDDYVYEMPKE